jgi:hypothetical protein
MGFGLLFRLTFDSGPNIQLKMQQGDPEEGLKSLKKF